MMKKITNSFSMMALILVLGMSACKKDKEPINNNDPLPNTVILAWNDIAFEALGGKQSNHALLASRVFAMVHVAMHDAVNATNPTYGRYAYIDTDKSANTEVAAASAAHQVLKTVFPNKAGFLDSALNVYLGSITESPAKSKGVNTGIAAANALLALGHNANGAENPIGLPSAARSLVTMKLYPHSHLFLRHSGRILSHLYSFPRISFAQRHIRLLTARRTQMLSTR
jgi:hypothetical protein